MLMGMSGPKSGTTAPMEDEDTWLSDGPERPSRSKLLAGLVLTIAHHPRSHRVGQRCWLSDAPDGEVRLSRLEPLFADGDGNEQPLALRSISRAAHRLRLTGSKVVVLPGDDASALSVDGSPLPDAGAALPMASLLRGVVFEIADRVVLVLHLLPRESEPLPAFGMVGESSAMLRLRRHIQQLVDPDVPVLLRGENGTGKELVARALHDSGSRRDGPFVAVNLSTIPPSLAASELFGHVKGAFTGAEGDSAGLFRRANGGTLLLDEVGDAPPEVQVALLRALETREVRALGSDTPTAVDVRVVTATDADLVTAVKQGRFRQALLHRIAGDEVRVPPLRERRADIGRLLHHFLREELAAIDEAERLEAERETPWLPTRLVSRLTRYHWPGNIRQLRNVARQIVIANRGRDEFEVPAQLESISEEVARNEPTAASDGSERPRPAEIDDDVLIAALANNRWEVSATATQLGIARNTLLSLIDRSPRVRRAKDLTREQIQRCLERHNGNLARMTEELRVSERGLKLRMRQLDISL